MTLSRRGENELHTAGVTPAIWARRPVAVSCKDNVNFVFGVVHARIPVIVKW